jgi:hypothetical protein
MMQAHEAMARVLDAKLANMPEWQAFRAIDRALLALDSMSDARVPTHTPAHAVRFVRNWFQKRRRSGAHDFAIGRNASQKSARQSL